MRSEMLYNFDGAVILCKGRKELARIVCVPKTENEKAFVGIITQDDTKIILDSDNPENDKIRELANEKGERNEKGIYAN